MGMILDYIEQAGKGKYQCFKTKKICLDSVMTLLPIIMMIKQSQMLLKVHSRKQIILV